MKIGMVAPVWERVPPEKYGGIELVVYLLTEELVKRGNQVTLFASGDSITSGELSSVYPKAMRDLLGNPCPDLHHVGTAFLRAAEYDLIHNHAGYSGIALANFVETPVLTTLHGIFTDINRPFFKAFKNSVYYNSISDEQRRGLPELNYIATVYNAIDISSYEYSSDKKDFFLWLSRISPLKGPDLVIDVAKKAGVKLKMAGKIDAGSDTLFYESKVEPLIDGDQIQYLGEVTEEEKRELMRDARAFLFPITWPEPFGLVMAEAMACGTPVIATRNGSVPEVVADGLTGFVVDSVDEMVAAIKKLDLIEPAKCRQYAEERFGVARMTDDYETIYRQVIEKGKPK